MELYRVAQLMSSCIGFIQGGPINVILYWIYTGWPNKCHLVMELYRVAQ
jgi:hypothetical protein